MAQNIEWATPDVTECWSFGRRIYRTQQKAELEKKRMQGLADRYDSSWMQEAAKKPVRHIKWEWD